MEIGRFKHNNIWYIIEGQPSEIYNKNKFICDSLFISFRRHRKKAKQLVREYTYLRKHDALFILENSLFNTEIINKGIKILHDYFNKEKPTFISFWIFENDRT